jgi:hypothetical protein
MESGNSSIPSAVSAAKTCRCDHPKSDHNLKHPMGCHKCSCTVYQPKAQGLNTGLSGDSGREVRSSAAVGAPQ